MSEYKPRPGDRVRVTFESVVSSGAPNPDVVWVETPGQTKFGIAHLTPLPVSMMEVLERADTPPIVVVTRDSNGRTVADWYETEDGYYVGDPIATAGYDVVNIRRNCPVDVASEVFRLYGMGMAGFAAAAEKAATHFAPEPGAPLEPIPGRSAA